MKKKTLLLTVGLVGVLCYGCGNQATTEQTPVVEENNTTEEAVTTEPEEETQEVEEEAEPEPETETVYLMSKETYYDENEEISSQYEYEYDQETGYKIKGTTNDGVNIEYEYYSDGILKRETALNTDGSLKYSNEYNEDGTESAHKSESEYGASETLYTYENGLLVSSTSTFYDTDGSINTIHNYKYNEFGDIDAEQTVLYFEGEAIDDGWGDVENEYDSKNRLIRTKHSFAPINSYSIQEYEYDENDNVIVDIYQQYNNDDTVISYRKRENTYDQFNNMTNSVDRDENDEIIQVENIENTYDDYGNLISVISKDKDDKIKLLSRTKR